MKKNSKIILLVFLFIGMLFTCFQYSIIQLSKSNKTAVSNISEEDANENSKQPLEEDDTNELENKMEDDYILSHIDFSFYKTMNSKTNLIVYEASKFKSCDLAVTTPPPKM